MDMYSYSFYFQVMMILALIAVVVWKGKFSRVFTAITGCFYLLYAVIQNMAVTGQHGFSMVTVNVVMIGFVALVWLWAAWKGNNEFSFDNVTWKTGWTIPVALFCLWWPMSLKTALPDFQLHYLYDGGSAFAFCPMTPVFLTLLVLSKRGVNRVVLQGDGNGEELLSDVIIWVILLLRPDFMSDCTICLCWACPFMLC